MHGNVLFNPEPQTSEIGSRLVKRKALHHPIYDSILRRRIGTQALVQTAEETKSMPNHHIDDRSVLIADFSQAVTFNRHVIGAQNFLRDVLANDEF